MSLSIFYMVIVPKKMLALQRFHCIGINNSVNKMGITTYRVLNK